MLKFGSNNIGKVYLGSNLIGKAYLGSNLVYEAGGTPAPPTPSPTPIYELQSATTTQNTDTGVKLFDSAKSFTILCEATFNNYSWTGTQAVFGISNDHTFRLGTIRSGNEYLSGELSSADVNRYTAIIMNSTSNDKMCCSLASRSNSSIKRKIWVRYDKDTRKVEAKVNAEPPTNAWWTVPAQISSNDTLKLLINSASGEVSIFKVYDTVLTDEQIADFINS